MSISGWARSAENWLMTHLPGAEWLILLGAAAVVLLLAALLVRCLLLLASGVGTLVDAGRARKARRSRILVAPPPGDRRQGGWVVSTLQTYLPVFSFGAPFSLVRMAPLRGGADPSAIGRARRRMETADADMFIWAARGGRGGRDLELLGLSRGGGLKPSEARFFSFRLPPAAGPRSEATGRATAFLLAKHLQPALSDPRAFRAEKIRGLAGELALVIDGAPDLPASLRDEVEADFCAAGVRVAGELGDLALLDQVIDLRRRYLEAASQAGDPGRVILAKLDLGRALIIRSEKHFEQAVVKEAIAHLAQAVEGLRADPVILSAQAASDALFKAQSMIESRKRFSLNFGS